MASASLFFVFKGMSPDEQAAYKEAMNGSFLSRYARKDQRGRKRNLPRKFSQMAGQDLDREQKRDEDKYAKEVEASCKVADASRALYGLTFPKGVPVEVTDPEAKEKLMALCKQGVFDGPLTAEKVKKLAEKAPAVEG